METRTLKTDAGYTYRNLPVDNPFRVKIKGQGYGHDDNGWHGTVIRGNCEVVAYFSDDGWGGEMDIDFTCSKVREEVETFIKDIVWESPWCDDGEPPFEMSMDVFIGGMAEGDF